MRCWVAVAEGVLPTGRGDKQSEGAARPPRQAYPTAGEGTARDAHGQRRHGREHLLRRRQRHDGAAL